MHASKHVLSRRAALKGVAATSALAALGSAGCASPADDSATSLSATGEGEKIVWSHCGINCGGCCSHQYHVKDGVITYMESDNTGSDEFDAPQMRACLRGRSARRWLQSDERLDYPLKRVGLRGEGKFERISWDEALDTIASELKRVYESYGPEAIFVPHGTGVYNTMIGDRAIKRLLGLCGGWLDLYGDYSFSQIYMASLFTYGEGDCMASGFETLEDGQLVVFFGYSPADTRMGGGQHGHLFQRMLEERNVRLISIDYRRNDTLTNWGGEWIPIRPGTDGALCCALAYEFIQNNWIDEEFLCTHCVGYDESTMPASARGKNASLKDYLLGTGYDHVAKTPEWASEITRIPADRIRKLAEEMGTADPVFICQGAGIQRRMNGESTARCIMMLPILLGQIGKPGTNDGRMPAASTNFLATLEHENPCEALIPFFLFPQAIEDGPSMTATNAGIRGAERLSTSIKFIFSYACNSLTNQHGNINAMHDLLADESKCEFIVASDVFITDSVKYADIVLPDLTVQEQVHVYSNAYAEPTYALHFGSSVYEPKAERRGIYEVCVDLAERMGVRDAFTEAGETSEEAQRKLYDTYREFYPDTPTWEEGFSMGVWKSAPDVFTYWEPFVADPHENPEHPEELDISFVGERASYLPEANYLQTPSGMIELYSEQLARLNEEWELPEGQAIYPIPVYEPGLISYENCTEELPLLAGSFHFKAHTHSGYTTNPILENEAPCWLWINPIDAVERGIADGDEVRIFNDLGEIRMPAKVTGRIVPGAVAMPEGSRHKADMFGDRIDRGGCINTIASMQPTALAKGNGTHSVVCQVEKVGE